MIPHIQKDFGEGTGDCFAACIASILDLPLDSVPNFRKLQEESKCGDMIEAADNWLRENHSKRFISIEMYERSGHEKTSVCLCNRLFHRNQAELVILSGESPRKRADGGTKYHAVVGRADCWGFELVHDPHPSGEGIVGQPYGVKWIVETTP